MYFEFCLIMLGTIMGSFLNDMLNDYKPKMVEIMKRLCYELYFKYTDIIFNIKLWLDKNNKQENKNDTINKNEDYIDEKDKQIKDE